MDLISFNIKDGFLEAMVRGYRSGFITMDEYHLLGQTESLEDMRTALEETDYGLFLQDEPLPLTVSKIVQKCREKFSAEFSLLRAQANYPLSKFLDFITYEKMIDNVVNIIQGAINKKSSDQLLGRMDPLGYFPEIKGILSLDLSSIDDLYKTILIETPIGPYFDQFLACNANNTDDISTVVRETDFEILRNSLKKSWLQDFYEFCTANLSGSSVEVMTHILKSEADLRVLSITLNSLNSNTQSNSLLYPNFGYLYPEGTEQIRKASNDTRVRSILESYPRYYSLYEECKSFYSKDNDFILQGSTNQNNGEKKLTNLADRQFKSFEDLLYGETVNLCELVFEQQMNYGIFYAWTKLKEQEIRNIEWIAEMITIQRKDQVESIVPIFSSRL